MVPVKEIEKNDFNLNIPRYIDSTEPEDLQDIEAHLKGGIPNRDIDDLDKYWKVFPSVRKKLFTSAGRPGYSKLSIESSGIKPAIFSHPEFEDYNRTVFALFEKWKKANTPVLKGIAQGSSPKALIEALSEKLLTAFSGGSVRSEGILNAYDVYQHLMNYWADTMQDDVYMLVHEGWKAVLEGKPNTDLIPRQLIIARYFPQEAKAIEQLEADRDAVSRQMEELDEEHSGEDGLFADARNDKGKLTKATVRARMVEIKDSRDDAEEYKLLSAYLDLIEQEAVANKKVKDAQKALDAKVNAQYGKLTEAEIKTLVVDDKWLAWLANDVQSELERVSQTLTGRIKQLAERYASPLPNLADEVDDLSAKVDGHLKKMGFVL